MKKYILYVITSLFIFITTPLVASDCSVTGQMVFMQLSSIRDIGPIVVGSLTKSPSMALFVRDSDWKSLSYTDREDLVCYVPLLVDQVNKDPAQYIDIPNSAPLFKKAMKNIKNMPSNAWLIYSGRLNTNGNVNFEETVASGR